MVKKKRVLSALLLFFLIISVTCNVAVCIRYNIFEKMFGCINHIGAYDTMVSDISSKESYLQNPQYNARLSTFELYENDTDIIFAGDSITEKISWNELFPSIECLNRGIGSDTTEGLLHRIDEIVLHRPNKIFILIGINDLSSGIAPEQAKNNMAAILEHIHSELPECGIFVESVLYAKDIDNNDVDLLNDYYKSVCMENSYAAFVDLRPVINLGGGQTYSADGVHLNGDGYALLASVLKDYVY